MFFPLEILTTRIEQRYTIDYKQVLAIYSESKDRPKRINYI
jgi:hypothetical protein